MVLGLGLGAAEPLADGALGEGPAVDGVVAEGAPALGVVGADVALGASLEEDGAADEGEGATIGDEAVAVDIAVEVDVASVFSASGVLLRVVLVASLRFKRVATTIAPPATPARAMMAPTATSPTLLPERAGGGVDGRATARTPGVSLPIGCGPELAAT